MSTVLLFAGGIIAFIGAVMIVIAAFRESVLWGIGALVIPLVALIFVFTHWSEAKTGFFWELAGGALIALGVVLAPEITTNAMM